MNWGSAHAFFEMGGYGLYVWGSYLVTVFVIAGELAALRGRRRAALAFAKRAHGQDKP
ncbi:MAG: heme exporter protein CcmD [Betaproteobacteria bacterium]|nr:heme exporter protein CcmD [Betaproteobacteria bacterium]